jgi:hypothetical protein
MGVFRRSFNERKRAVRTVLYSRTLLLLDAGEHRPKLIVAKVGEAFGTNPRSLEHLKKRLAAEKRIELNVLKRNCLTGRIDCIKKMRSKVTTWNIDRNNRQSTVDWQFRTDQARVKLKRLYPIF